MLAKSIIVSPTPLTLGAKERRVCIFVIWYVIVQCFVVFGGATTVLQCAWNPDTTNYEWDKIARVMYLFDPKACYYNLTLEHGLTNIKLSNNTRGIKNIYPIAWKPAYVAVSVRLSAIFRHHLYYSIGMHICWMLSALILCFFLRTNFKIYNKSFTKRAINLFLYVSLAVILFDISMAIVYIVQIQKSVTIGMILRNSGWSMDIKVKNNDAFAGWLVMVASCCWLRGIIFIGLNIYCCKVIKNVKSKIMKKEVKTRLMRELNLPFPSPVNQAVDQETLYYQKELY